MTSFDQTFEMGVHLITRGVPEGKGHATDFVDRGDLFLAWPGFVTGMKDGKYTFAIPKFEPRAKPALQWDTADKPLIECLKALGIDVHALIQYTPPPT